jgi:arginine/lysine/ornithine decarboxylase
MRFVGGSGCHALIQRNSHRSIIHGLRFTGAKISTVRPEFSEDFSVFLPITLDAIIDTYKANNSINLIVITSPTYEGLSADI